MKIFLQIAIFLISSIGYAQDFTRTFTSRGKQYIILANIDENEFTKIEIKKSSDESVLIELRLKPFSFDQFKSEITPILRAEAAVAAGISATDIDAIIQNLFYDTVAHFLSTTDERGPIAGFLTINPEIDQFDLNSDNRRKISTGKSVVPKSPLLAVRKVELEIFEGFLENISVTVRDRNARNGIRVYSNEFGIGFASKNNMGDLHNYFLVEKDAPIESRTMINLGQLIRYDLSHKPGRRDYSPVDDSYTYILDGAQQTHEMFKSPSKRLIEARIFSDFIGLDQDKPNGIIQTEISKRINMNTNRGLIFYKNNAISNGLRFILGQGGGVLQYVIPTLVLSKIEQNNRDLIVRRDKDSISTITEITKMPILNDNGEQIGLRDSMILKDIIVPKPYLTALELLRHQNFSAGIDLNIFYSENVGGKFNFYLDAGLKFGRTSISDSTKKIETYTNSLGAKLSRIVSTGMVNTYGVNSFQIYPEFKIQWLPDERFGINFSHRWTFFRMWNGEIENSDISQRGFNYTTGKSTIDGKNSKSWLNCWELFAFLKLTESGRLFFRYRLNYESGNRKYNFNQAQVGYSFYILGSRKSEKGAKSSE
ncbi:hypothetical protein [Dyadobacter sp. 22481]|uniref:hypothetical protein n=1 Tax=Dyadobacter sp. 22481 TaxID=3453926 RepID=UPI003F86D1AA